jgi:hypothetical protein
MNYGLQEFSKYLLFIMIALLRQAHTAFYKIGTDAFSWAGGGGGGG